MRQSKPRVRLLPYKQASASARAVARGAGILRIPMNRQTRFIGRPGDVLVNWGYAYSVPLENRWDRVTWVNDVGAVHRARDKRITLSTLSRANVPTVDWSVEVSLARQWYNDGNVVVQRNTATGQGGAGIVICDPTLTVNVAPSEDGVLWTKYFKRKHEYRVHVWRGEVLDVQQKKKRRGAEADSRIRSYNKGWVFCRDNVVCPEPVSQAAVQAVAALGLDFGAVDIGWNEKFQQAAVFEVNTAPGVEGTTLEKYVAKIRELATDRESAVEGE